jgi:hypothetical protein
MHFRQVYRVFLTTSIFMLTMAGSIAQAGIVDLTLFGETTSASDINDFGLNVGDQVSLKATFDYSVLSGLGSESINFSQGSGNSLSLFMGDLTFVADNDIDFFAGYPLINFFDGIFSGIDYVAYSGTNGAPADLNIEGDTNWYSESQSGRSQQWVTGIWDDDTLSITGTPDIPEPGPLALVGIGLLGAWVASRRRKTLS